MNKKVSTAYFYVILFLSIISLLSSVFVGYKYIHANRRANFNQDMSTMLAERRELSMLGLKKYSHCIYSGGDSIDLCLEALKIYEDLFPDFEYYAKSIYNEKINF